MNKFFICKKDKYEEWILVPFHQEEILDTRFENLMKLIENKKGYIRIIIENDTICYDNISENNSPPSKLWIEKNYIPEELKFYLNGN